MEDTIDRVELTPEQEAEEEAAFEAVIDGTSAPEIAQEPAAVEEAQETPEVQEPQESEPVPDKTLTVDDLKAMLDAERAENQKTRDRLFGKIGDLQHKIDAARTSASGISPDARDKLSEEFPELAAILFAKSQTVQKPEKTEKTPDIQEIIKREVEPVKLSLHHPDWQDVARSAEFATWRDTVVSAEDRQQLANTWDSSYLSGKLSEFKAWQKQKQEQTVKQQSKVRKLEAAVTPNGIPRNSSTSLDPDDEEAIMEKYFKRR